MSIPSTAIVHMTPNAMAAAVIMLRAPVAEHVPQGHLDSRHEFSPVSLTGAEALSETISPSWRRTMRRA
jgi:hypothetical protein